MPSKNQIKLLKFKFLFSILIGVILILILILFEFMNFWGSGLCADLKDGRRYNDSERRILETFLGISGIEMFGWQQRIDGKSKVVIF